MSGNCKRYRMYKSGGVRETT
ncbi:MAG: KxYKxGKxW signal peptide domain-containing protein [Alkaliphilus sp.]